jgi:glycosyltransferase involved in cell wall biosynthesis
MGTRNGARYIEEQLRSILAQTQPPTEVVISDDASTDDTVALAQRVFTDSTVSLRVIRNPVALGVVKNFEQAILACSGDLVALSDQDDRWHPRRLELSTAAIEGSPHLQLVHGNATLIDGDGHALGPTLFDAIEVDAAALAAIHAGGAFDILMRRNVVTGATVMVRRQLAVDAAPFPSAWVHDEWLAIVAAARDGVDVIDEQLIDYRQHQSNEIGVKRLSVLGKSRRMLEPGAERSARLLARAAQLAERLRAIDGVEESRRAAAQQKLKHEQMRSALGVHRLTRIVPVLRELATGRYSAFGRGGFDAVRDLLQPLGRAG